MPAPRSIIQLLIIGFAFAAPILAAEESKEKAAPPYTRCGGEGWHGPTKCIGDPEWSLTNEAAGSSVSNSRRGTRTAAQRTVLVNCESHLNTMGGLYADAKFFLVLPTVQTSCPENLIVSTMPQGKYNSCRPTPRTNELYV
ncbi:hypothetical protein HYPSUDRAFT_53164 [Hypholoma sublateritium FD-334 SS-4]|uniref:CBM1 domain-containing protein n=1 Tax=Hypholoma sublateritium (strain FD-334 SS-4) TaxID=945553 RepID=A0A0D2LD32_HYPSF|nr:hypothetical protein HYPSUDRAFT_53164 [Hypholoma sublateritium FD-334 SS-4]